MSTEFDQTDNGYTLLDLGYAGFNSRVVCMDRETGAVVWDWKATQGTSTHVAVLLDGDRLIVSVRVVVDVG